MFLSDKCTKFADSMANIYDNRRIWKTVFLAVSLVLVAFFLHISNNLVDDLADQERERMEIWANATKALTSAQSSDIDFYLSIIKNNNNIPVLLVDDNDNILMSRNFKMPEPVDSLTPDLLSIFLVVATQANGAVLIHQKMFESRLFFVDKLIDMGAQIILCDPHRAVVIGHNHGFTLRGGNMTSPDIRAGIALLIAAMSAEGISRIHNIEQIDRGYQNIEGRLNAIGARITRI